MWGSLGHVDCASILLIKPDMWQIVEAGGDGGYDIMLLYGYDRAFGIT